MSDITTANVVYVSSSKNGDYVQTTPHDGAARYIRADAPELVALVDAMRPFARSGKLFPEPPETVEFDKCIYKPAAGPEYSLCGDHLRAARLALAKWDAMQ